MIAQGESSMAQALRFGICTDQNQPWDVVVERWKLFEQLGFDSAWNCDHWVQPSRPEQPYFEAWTMLAGLAAVTERIRIGVLVSCNTFRHPAWLAKEAVTLDHISNGRLEFGLGAGWYVPEHEMLGIEFPAAAELVGRFREAVEIVDLLMRNEYTTYSGKYYQLNQAAFRPGPVQLPRPPLTLGAKGPRMLEIVARYGDAWNSSGSPEDMAKRNRVLDEHCARLGRNPEEIVRGMYGWAAIMPDDPWQSVSAFEECIGRYREAGVNEFIIDQPRDEQFGVLERVATEIIPRLRSEQG
jgi:alkanesulfonate monooxygenase SsuD/methylene tetrahydromethanopterin reductase-like flavin-dependent oxidoreductase (luciferase family)